MVSQIPQNADFARTDALAKAWLPFIIDGGWLALGGSYYNYVREIPIGANYEIWLSIGGWDQKWVRILLIPAFLGHSLVICAWFIGIPDHPLRVISQR